MKTYIPISSTQATHLELDLYYSKGGMNYFSYKEEPRGYYYSVTPVTKETNSISFTAFSGIKHFVHGCERKSDKQYKIALSLLTENLKDSLIAKVLAKLTHTNDLKNISKALGVSIPGRFEGMTQAQIEALPVLIVGLGGSKSFKNLKAAKESFPDFNKLCGPFGCEARDHLRFETKEAFDMLSA